jgi:diguanylate cyclase (GGDEF)-like protein/PAS domain S-box-containing protein
VHQQPAKASGGLWIPRDPVLGWLAIGGVLAIGWLSFGPAPATVSWLVQVALDVAFVRFCWWVAQADTTPVAHRFWIGMSLAGVFCTLGDSTQTILTLGSSRPSAATGTAQTVLVAVGVGCVVWCMLTHPMGLAGRERLRFWLDAATVMAAATVFAWYFSAGGWTSADTVTQLLAILLGSGLLLVSAFGMVKLLLSGTAPFTVQAGVTGGLAAALIGVDTSLNSAVAAGSDLRLLLIARVVPCVLLTASPRIQQVQMRTDPRVLSRHRRRQYSRLPYVAVAATQILLITALLHSGLTVGAWGVVIGVVAITTLVVVRQTVAFLDNAQLLASLDASMLQLRRQERRFRSLVHHASDITVVLSPHGRVMYASPALDRVLGIDPDQIGGMDPHDLIHPDDVADTDRLVAGLIAHARGSATTHLRARHADGSWRWLEVVATNLLDDRSVAGIILNARDITEERQLHDRLRYDATHDALTGLANRALFDERVRTLAARGGFPGLRMAVLAIDLDDFKPINDLLGHHIGDAVLVTLASRLRRCVQPTDTVARLGGDEFAVLLPESSRAIATLVADRIMMALAEPVSVDEHDLSIRASVGIAVGPPGEIESLVRDADSAMYTVKRDGKGRYRYADDAPSASQVTSVLEL